MILLPNYSAGYNETLKKHLGLDFTFKVKENYLDKISDHLFKKTRFGWETANR